MIFAATIGVYLLIAGGVLAAAELLILGMLGRRLRAARRHFETVRAAQTMPVLAALERLRVARRDRDRLAAPWRRAWRWYRHPLTQAYFGARRRRRIRLEREPA